jgi:hypothetical protein
LSSVARSLRETLESTIGSLPDIVLLVIGLAVAAWALWPVLNVVGAVRGVIGGAGPATPSQVQAQATPNQYSTVQGGNMS